MSLLHRSISVQLVFVIVCLSISRVAHGQDEPILSLTQAEVEKIKERSRLSVEALALRRAGKFAEAAAMTEKLLAMDRQAFGPNHENVARTLDQLRDLAAAQENFALAKKNGQESLDVRTKLYGQDSWHVTDSRQALAEISLLERLSPKERAELAEVDRQDGQIDALDHAGKLKEALALARAVVDKRGQIQGETHPKFARSLYVLARMNQEQGAYGAAEPLYRRALEIRKVILGENHPDYASSLNGLAILYKRRGAFEKAEPLFRQALDIRKRVQGERHPDYASSLNNLAQLYQTMGAYSRAEPLYLQTLDTMKKTLGENHIDYATGLNNLALLYQTQGDYVKAEPMFRQVLDITKKTLGESHPEYAKSLNNLANLYQEQGAYDQAERLCRQALESKKQSLGGEHPEYARSLNDLANVYRYQGAYARSELLLRQCLEIRKKTLGENHPDYARSLNDLARLLRDQGDYGQAEALMRQDLAILKKAFGENNANYAVTLHDLAGLCQAQGAYARAEPLYHQALEIEKKVLGENHKNYASTLHNLANLYKEQSEYARAEPLYKKSLEITMRALGENHPQYAIGLHSLAALYRAQGNYAPAEPLYRRSLEINKRVLGENHANYALGLNNLANLFRDQGEFAQADPLYQESLKITKRALSENHPNYALTSNNLAYLYQAQGANPQAEACYRQALEITLANLHVLAAGQSEQRQQVNAVKFRSYLDNYLAHAVQASSSPEISYRFVLAWKGALFSRRQRLLRERERPELAAAFEEYQRTSQQLVAAAFATVTPAQQAAWRERFSGLNARREELEGELARMSASFRSEKSLERLQAEQLAKVLPKSTALVDYLEYTHSELPKDGKGKPVLERRLLAFVVRPDKALVRIDLGPSEPVAKLVDGWRGTLKRQHPVLGKDDPAIELRKRIWEPLAKHLEGVTTVLVSPDGALCRLPFTALPGRDADKYLLEEVALTIVPVPQLLPALLAPATESKKNETVSLLIAGDVDFDAAPSEKAVVAQGGGFRRRGMPDRGGMLGSWKRLEATRDEILSIEDSFKEAGAQVHELRGSAATVDAVRNELGKHAYVHLATHGFFATVEVKSQFQTRIEKQGPESWDSQKNRSVGYDPGLLSGLVFAGANKHDGSGILTATEVAELDLRKVELAVLSACETGLGEVAGGEGVMGLQRAFQAAGTRTTVTSLWKVDDAQTKELMVKFYRTYKDSGQMLESLRQAQLAMLRDGLNRGAEPLDKPEANTKPGRTPPFYWAAFVSSGDWR